MAWSAFDIIGNTTECIKECELWPYKVLYVQYYCKLIFIIASGDEYPE